MNPERLEDTYLQRQFNPNHSELETNPEKIAEYVRLLEKELGRNFTVDGILEIGSYAKGEAVPGSDIDTRVYVSSPDFYLRQTSSGRFRDSKQTDTDKRMSEFIKANGVKPILDVDWYDFNEPVAKKLCQELGINIEFGLSDSHFAKDEIQHLDQTPSFLEHQILLESNLIYDPQGQLAKIRLTIDKKIYPTMADFYQQRYLDSLPSEIYEHLQPHKFDAWKLEKSRQIQWLKWAVRSIRDAIASKTYLQEGRMIYKKEDILNFCQQFLSPEDFSIVEELYKWKTDPQEREKMIEDFLKNPKKYFLLFQEYTKKLEVIVQRINNL